jgi:hypothetical protein
MDAAEKKGASAGRRSSSFITGDKSRFHSNPSLGGLADGSISEIAFLQQLSFSVELRKRIVMKPELVAEYDRLLSQTQEMLALYREKQWVSILEGWRDELTSAAPDVDLRQHADRTARALGGMESIGEVALARHDEAFTKLLDALYATCTQIRNA